MQRSFNLLQKASKENEVFLCTFNQKAWLPETEQMLDAKKKLEKYYKVVEVLSIPSDNSRILWGLLVLYSFIGPTSYTVNWTTSKKMQELVDGAIRRYCPDIIHCDTLGLAHYVLEKESARTVLNHHNIESQMMLRRAEKEENFLKKLYFFQEGTKLRTYEKKICPLVAANIVVSELDRMRLLEIAPKAEVRVVPNGVDVDYFRAVEKSKIRHNLVFAGSMDWYPNEDAMVYFLNDIWPHLKNIHRDASLTIAGRMPSQRLKDLISLDTSVQLTGYVEDIRPLIDQAEIYVCPIRDGGGTKLKLLDAMAMRKAIVTTTVGAEGFDVRDGEHVLIADDPKGFVEKICSLFENEELRHFLSRNARIFVEKYYSWEVIGKELLDVYGAVGK